MSANYMSDNYCLRNHFLRTQEVPTQSLIKKKMSEPLAAVYFNSMTPKLKLLAGLEPPMKGGGSDWYVPPEDLLKGRTVLKPLKKEYLSRLNYIGIDEVCTKSLENRRKCMILETNKVLSENDDKWKRLIEDKCENLFKNLSEQAAKKNSEKILKDYNDFKNLYAVSMNTIETVVFDAASSEINRIQNETLQKMKDKYKTSVKKQATALHDTFTNRLMSEKIRLRGEFVQTVAKYRSEMGDKIHDLKLEKHVTIDECRKFWECQRLACQIYVALKEQEELKKNIKLSDYTHKKKVKILSDEIAMKDHEITGRARKENLQLEFDTIWQKKVWYIYKHFQMYVSYCLSLLPAYADFFINMEKLMLLHLNEVLENPSAESIFEFEMEWSEGPRPDPHPFYLFCDKSHKYEVPLEKDLCPKHCTSSASHMPVLVINKRCMYAACDNFEQFTNKVKHYILGERGDDMDFTDDHVYEHDVPVKYTTSQQLSELKLESSLLQVMYQELPTPFVGSVCKVPDFFRTSPPTQATKTEKIDTLEQVGPQQIVSHSTPASNDEHHKKELTMETTYLKFIEPKQCTCSKTAKKHLMEHLPVYMRRPSIFDTLNNLPSYETCSLASLKKMIRKARESVALPIQGSGVTTDVATQYNDEQYDALCTCFSDEIIHDLMKTQSAELYTFYQPTKNATNFDFLCYSGLRTSVSDSGSD